MKSSPAALPIMMLGGSPMRVAVPPMFEARISPIRSGTGLIPRPTRQEERHRRDEHHRGDVVQEGRATAVTSDSITSSAVRVGRRHPRGRTATLEDAGAADDVAHHHHPGQQEDDVEVDAANAPSWSRTPRDDEEEAGDHGDQRSVRPFEGDQDVGDDEDDRGNPQRGLTGDPPRRLPAACAS